MKKLRIITMIVSSLILTGAFQNANTQNLTGREIVDKTYNRPTGEDQESDLKMILLNSSGDTRIREIKQFTKEMGDVEKSIMFFISPADVRNTSFMNWSYDDDRADDQWIYLPALKKVKRISSDSKSDYFMGSDFTYDDLGDRKLEEDTHQLLREEEINGKACYVVESIPVDKDYMYSKTITWIEKETFIGVKKEFYDEDGDLLKILSINEYKNFDGFDIITSSEMKNIQKNHRTQMELSNIQINTGVSDLKFSERMMTRGL
ncbi:MAG: outer membrane lipoprotein-sorting protein [Bacteroidales bacterium]|nr:outer membrane lipoprotein-sorting protein [Bacteroidales bacterium]